ncbi:MAG: HlyD family efflux transporter periplasmic adaptor subunit [Acidobacteria bacterium]|nr:HlyD family efflux transporter periplasmic adaptor subunit [Acidobacteriota bacterium]
MQQDSPLMQGSSAMDRPVEKPRWSRQRLLLLAIVVILVGGFALLYPAIRRWATAETSVSLGRIRIGTVSRGDLIRDVSAQGSIIAAFSPTLTSPVRGTARVEVHPGEVVERGRILVKVESPEVESRLGQERSTLVSLQADWQRQRILAQQSRIQGEQDIRLLEVELEAANRALDRAERIRREGLLNAVEYEEAQDDVKVTSLKLELSRSKAQFDAESREFEISDRASRVERQHLVVEDLQRQVDELAIRSPVAGLVSRVSIKDRDSVTAGQPIVTVVDLSAFEVEVMIPENYSDEISPGVEAVIRYDNRDWAGTVKSISPEVEGSRVRTVVEFSGEAPTNLRQNQRVSTRLLLERRANVLKVQRGPFLENGSGRQAYRIEDGIAVLSSIEIGSLSISEVEILSGLEVGDQIIISDTSRFEGAERVLLTD